MRIQVISTCLQAAIFDKNHRLLEGTEGRFESQNMIFQEFFKLPMIEGYNVQLSTFTAAGTYAGSGVRVDPSLVIKLNSDTMPLRVLPDAEM